MYSLRYFILNSKYSVWKNLNKIKMSNLVHTRGKTLQDYKQLTEIYEKALWECKKEKISEKETKEIASLYNNLGHSKYMQVLFDDAVEDYTKAIEYDNSLAVAYYNRGTIFYRMGCFEDAYKDFKIAVELEPSNEEFLSGLEACGKNI